MITSKPETISNNIKYSFNQFELAIVGFVSYMQLKLNNIIENIPVFIQNSGDFSYMVDKKFIETKNEEIIHKVPRFIIKIDDIQQNQQENTNQYNKIFYTFENVVYQSVVRRLCYNVNLTTNFVSSNIVTLLNHIEIMATFAARDNVYTYDFMGNTCQAAFAIQGSGNEFPSIDMGQGGTRNLTVSNQIELQVHLLVPRIESIIAAEDAKLNRIDYNIIQRNKENILYNVPSGYKSDNESIINTSKEEINTKQEKLENDLLNIKSKINKLPKSDDTQLILDKENNCSCNKSPRLKYKSGYKIPINFDFK